MAHSATESNSAALLGAAARGGLWLAATMVVSRASGFLFSIILARLIAPGEFGLFGMANVVLTAVAMLAELGLSAALVQRTRGRDYQDAASTAFWTSVVVGWTLVAANALFAPLTAWYFGDPAVTGILRVMGLQLGINAVGAVHHALLSRELDYRRKLLPDTVPGIVNGGVAVAAAAYGWGAWSLVAGAQLGALVGVVVVWTLCRWRPSFVWRSELAGALLSYGRHVIGAELLRFVTLNVDYLVVGRLFGPVALGVYTLAFNLANLVVSNIGFLFARVAFPLFCRLQHDPDRLRESYLRLLGHLALLTIPAMVGLCLLAEEVITVVYGVQWAGAVVPLRVLTVLGAVRALATLSGDVVRALGRPDILGRLGLLTAVLTVSGTILGAAFGLVGVAVAETLVAILTASLLARASLALLGLRGVDLMARLASIVRAAALMSAPLAVAVPWLATAGVPPVWRLAAAAIAGAALFVLGLGRERRAWMFETRRRVRRATRPAPAWEGLSDAH
jgi:O-antigen/teichoic acid export membrane protein